MSCLWEKIDPWRLYRVVQLADRESGKKPERANPYHCIVPLTHILSDIFRVGPQSKAVGENMRRPLRPWAGNLKFYTPFPLKR